MPSGRLSPIKINFTSGGKKQGGMKAALHNEWSVRRGQKP